MGERSVEELWTTVLGDLQVQVTRANYETWLKGTAGLALEAGVFTIGVPSPFAQEWLQHRLSPLIRKTVTKVVGSETNVEFTMLSPRSESGQPSPLFSPDPEMPKPVNGGYRRGLEASPPLSSRYTFDSFVVGSANRFAHAAAIGVTENPGQAYNPFFLYGGVGLGKTHLLHAIGHQCMARGLRVLYVTSEQFTNEFINALRERRTEEYRAKYRGPDVLLIDDIQFLADKEQTQESFFHTFNDLHNANRQIIISSDRPPRSMPLLEERLRSRFEWGLLADIQPPDLETRLAILQNKADELGVSLPADILDLIAHRFQSNVRELEGALNRVLAYSKAVDAPLTLDTATKALSELLQDGKGKNLSSGRILEAIALHFSFSVEQLISARRSKDLAHARQVAMYLLRNETRLSLSEIGGILGGRDHSTVVHGYEKIASQAEENTALRRSLMELTSQLRAT